VENYEDFDLELRQCGIPILMPALTITGELLDKGVDFLLDTVKEIERKV
jgi:hypothetical protein